MKSNLYKVGKVGTGYGYCVRNAAGHELFTGSENKCKRVRDLLIEAREAQPATIEVDIEGIGQCTIPVRNGKAYMPMIIVLDIVSKATAPVKRGDEAS